MNGVWHHLVVLPLEWTSTIFGFLILIILMIGAIPLGYLREWAHPDHPRSAWNDLFRSIMRIYFYAAGIRVEVEGLEHLPKNQPVLLAGNHPSRFDGQVMDLVMGNLRATAMTAPFGYFPWPFSFWFGKIGAIDVARTKAEEKKYPKSNTRHKAIELMVYKLTKLKKVMLIFPEGHVERVRHALPYKTGAVRIALLAGVPLIPFTLRGSERVFAHSWMLRPGTIRVIIHPAFDLPTDPKAVEDHELIDLYTSQLLCEISKDLPQAYYTDGMIRACREILAYHPVTRRAISKKSKPKS